MIFRATLAAAPRTSAVTRLGVFENVTGFEMPVMTNLFASRLKMAAALDVPLEETLNEYMRREDQPFEPQWVDDGPVKECRWVGEEADLSRLPIVTHGEKDAGPYINPGVGIAKDPDTGNHNAGIYRLLYRGPQKMGIDIGPLRCVGAQAALDSRSRGSGSGSGGGCSAGNLLTRHA